MPESFKTRKWGLGEDIFSRIHSYKGRESENVVLNMQSNALQGRSEKLNKDEYRIYYVGLTRAKKNLQYTEFVSEKVDYKKFLNRRIELIREFEISLISEVVSGRRKVI